MVSLSERMVQTNRQFPSRSMSKAFRVVALHSWKLVTSAKLLARRNHPVRKVEHSSGEKPWAIYAGLHGDLFQTDLTDIVDHLLTMRFSEFILPVVHVCSFSVTSDQSIGLLAIR